MLAPEQSRTYQFLKKIVDHWDKVYILAPTKKGRVRKQSLLEIEYEYDRHIMGWLIEQLHDMKR